MCYFDKYRLQIQQNISNFVQGIVLIKIKDVFLNESFEAK